jgi:alkylated DNA repair dioxygenase AlkB
MNLLPTNGTVLYYANIFDAEESKDLLSSLLIDITWQHDENFIYGKKIITKRKVAWYGDKPFNYTYSKVAKTALPFNKVLLQIKSKVEAATNETYNSCLLNLYHTGQEGTGWHSDAEKELKPNGAIASVSFGATRKFVFKHKATQQQAQIILENGSILLMKDETQTHWLHKLPATTKINKARVNLTFRTIIE